MSCAHCEALSEELAYLRSELGLTKSTTDVAKFHDAWGMRRATGRLVAALYQAKGRVVSRWQLKELYPNADDFGNIVSVHVSLARRALGKGAIINAWGDGYRLSPEGIQAVSAVL